jgi:hypothetical protein
VIPALILLTLIKVQRDVRIQSLERTIGFIWSVPAMLAENDIASSRDPAILGSSRP